jgi:hypothetical protein
MHIITCHIQHIKLPLSKERKYVVPSGRLLLSPVEAIFQPCSPKSNAGQFCIFLPQQGNPITTIQILFYDRLCIAVILLNIFFGALYVLGEQ